MRPARTAVLAGTAALVGLLAAAPGLSAAPPAAQAVVAPPATPRADCGPGSVPETGVQGRVPGTDVAAGKVAQGFRCNVELVSRSGRAGGFKVERYTDAAGHDCAFYDTTLLFPTNAANLSDGPTGVAVLDMSNPAKPVQTATLSTLAMQTPHESLLVNKTRGLLAAVAGNPLFAPGQVDLYDVSEDCRQPVLRSSLPVGLIGHESGFSPDGKTFWAASLSAGILTAVDVTDPSLPRTLWTGRFDTHALSISDDGNRAYLAATGGFPRNEIGLPAGIDGVVVVDVSSIQARSAVPQPVAIGSVTWPTVTIPQAALPVTIGGKPYLVESDEFSYDGTRIAGNGERVGAARIIDIADERKPVVVSDLRLTVHDPKVRPGLTGDPAATSATGGYAGHYCAVPQRKDPGIVACSMLASGLRVFDIRDPRNPREVAYFVAPVPPGGTANAAFSSASFVPERREIWYSDGDRGLYVLRLTNGAWPQAAAVPAAPVAAPAAPAAPAGAAPGGRLPATGLALPVGAALVLLLASLAVRRVNDRRA